MLISAGIIIHEESVMKAPKQSLFGKARDLFRRHGGVLRARDVLRLGIHPRTLYEMRAGGHIEQLGRGLYCLAGLKLGNPDLVAVSLKAPQGVVCLISALAFHKLTTQIPHRVYLALPRGGEPPRMQHPPVRVFWFAARAFTEGVETHKLDGASVRVYSPERTLADCFKFRNKIGLDTAIEAVKFYRKTKGARVEELMHFAAVCRVQKIMRPYLEALL
jgi:predicted transcriptional regulator of viral defense system